jgi:hypothetical protein
MGKSKGRSFGTREDKMREHVRTVHMKSGKRKRDGSDVTIEEVEQEEYEEENLGRNLLRQDQDNEVY